MTSCSFQRRRNPSRLSTRDLFPQQCPIGFAQAFCQGTKSEGGGAGERLGCGVLGAAALGAAAAPCSRAKPSAISLSPAFRDGAFSWCSAWNRPSANGLASCPAAFMPLPSGRDVRQLSPAFCGRRLHRDRGDDAGCRLAQRSLMREGLPPSRRVQHEYPPARRCRLPALWTHGGGIWLSGHKGRYRLCRFRADLPAD